MENILNLRGKPAITNSRLAHLSLAAVAIGILLPLAHADTVVGVTIEDVSSELGAPFDRPAVYAIDGAGFDENTGFHSPAADGVSWLNTGTFQQPNDPNVPGAIITFDLEANYDLDSFKVWNYNEVNLPARGSNEVEVLVAASEGGAFTSLGNFSFTIAPGADGVDFGQVIDLSSFAAANNTRLVRFNILSNHGGDNNFVGLSEVRFEASPTGVVVFPATISSAAALGTVVGTLSTPPGDPGDTFTYAFVAGEGDTDNGKFQIAGDELQAGAHNFITATDGEEFTVRVLATGSPSGELFEAALIITVSADSDADNLPDAYELLWAPDVSVLSGLADADADGDGLTDLEEFNLRNQFPALDPTMADTDGDSLNDGAEIAGADARPPTDPTNPDTDDDSLSDAAETNTGTFISATDTGTDPTNPDTDGDGVDDATEVTLGSDPNDPNDLPPVSLVGLWRFEGNADDSSGLKNHGTVMNGVTFDSDVPAALGGGQSASFTTGVDHDQHILVPHSPTLDITGEITITAWIKPENNSWDGIIAKTPNEGSGLNFPGNYELRTNNGGGLLEFGWEHNPAAANTFTFTAPSATGVTANEWAHVAFTAKAGDDYIYYIDGAEVGRGAMPDTFGTELNTNPLYLGNRADLTTIEFHGLMDDVALFSGVLTEGQILAIMGGDFSAFGIGSSKLQLQIDQVGDDLVISWDSQGGKLYNLRSETDPSDGEPGDWPIFDGHMDLEATPPRNTLTFPLPADPERFFVIEEFDAPPVVILGDNFENGIGDWTTGSDGAAGTEWELGLPSNVGPTDAHSPLNCFGTNLFADYDLDADVWLRSPAIDLGLAGSATLNYWEFKDIEEGFDFGTIRVLNAADDSLLAEIETGIDDVTADWERVSHSLPAAALGTIIKIEFRFESDDISNFAGWYLDDFEVTVP